jgi:hypothetical protein
MFGTLLTAEGRQIFKDNANATPNIGDWDPEDMVPESPIAQGDVWQAPFLVWTNDLDTEAAKLLYMFAKRLAQHSHSCFMWLDKFIQDVTSRELCLNKRLSTDLRVAIRGTPATTSNAMLLVWHVLKQCIEQYHADPEDDPPAIPTADSLKLLALLRQYYFTPTVTDKLSFISMAVCFANAPCGTQIARGTAPNYWENGIAFTPRQRLILTRLETGAYSHNWPQEDMAKQELVKKHIRIGQGTLKKVSKKVYRLVNRDRRWSSEDFFTVYEMESVPTQVHRSGPLQTKKPARIGERVGRTKRPRHTE